MEVSTRLRLAALCAILGGAVAFEYFRLALVLAATAVNEDVTLMWYTTREWGRWHYRQPNIYGQAYGWSPEALPMEALRRIGVTPWTATMLVLAAFAVLGWLLLAMAAWHRSHQRMALLAVVAPSLLGAYYAFYVTAVPTYQGPHLVTIAGAALLLLRPRRAELECAAWTLLGLGLLMDPSAALLAVPVALAHLLAVGLTRRRLCVLGAGSVLPVAYFAWSWWFYRAHPDYVLFGVTSVRPSWSTLVTDLHYPARYFRLTTLELVPYWPVLLVAVVMCVAALVATRQARYAIPAIVVPLLLAWGLATPKATGDFGPFMPPGRIFATLPHALWFLVFLVSESGVLRSLPGRKATVSAALGALVCVAILSIVVRQVDFHHRVLGNRDSAVRIGTGGLGYGFVGTSTLLRQCHALDRAAEKTHSELLIFERDRLAAYGCGALAFGRLETLVAERERRTWRLYEELDRTRTAAILGDVPKSFCVHAAPLVQSCHAVEGGGVALRFPRQSILALMERLSISVRDFGPACVPEAVLGGLGCEHPLRLSIRALTVGPPPRDRRRAEAAIRQAFAEALDVNKDFASVEAGATVARTYQPERNRYQEAVGSARVDLRRVQFVSSTAARVDLAVTTSNGRRTAATGWALHMNGSWLVERKTFSAIQFLAAETSAPHVPDDGPLTPGGN